MGIPTRSFGHVATRDEALMQSMRDWAQAVGLYPRALRGPGWCIAAWRRSNLRFARMCDTAETLAPRLAAHTAIKSLVYPGLPGHPGHALAAAR